MLSFFGALVAVYGFIMSNLTTPAASIGWKWVEGLGVVLAALGALISSVQQNRASGEIHEKNLEIIGLHRKISDTLTGGTSYCYLMIHPEVDNQGSITEYVCVMPPRQNPLYDVKMQYSDTSIALSQGNKCAEELFRLVKGGGSFNAMGKAKYDQFHNFGAILPIGFFKLWPISIADLPFVMNARFYARNGWWHQSIMWVQGNDGKVARADFVVRLIPKPSTSDCEVLRREVSKNFPDQKQIFVRMENGNEISSDIPFCCIPRAA